MLDFITFKWKPAHRYRSHFQGHHVNVWASMLARNYRGPCRFSCITDDPTGIDKHIRIIPLWKEYAALPSAWGSRNPSCYRRLKIFSAEAAQLIGPRFVCTDLDIVVTADVTPLFERPEDFVIWKSPTPPPMYLYNGSLLMLRAGTRVQLWKDFHPVRSVQETRRRRFFGSDQAWISMKLGPGQPTWSERDGVYSYRLHIEHRLEGNRAIKLTKPNELPSNARIVIFHGEHDPWDKDMQAIPWIKRHWQ